MGAMENDVVVDNDSCIREEENDVVDNDSSIREECENLVACDNVHPASSGFFASKIRCIMEWMASRSWGQMVFKSVDRLLWSVERTLIWQNPDKVSLVPMDRPINVLFAYPLAAFLWILQHSLFSTAETSSATDSIKWVQTRRRRLRAIRFHGIRNMRGQDTVLIRPWLFGIFSSFVENSGSQLQTEVGEKYNGATLESDIEGSEHNKKRRFSSLSVSVDDGTIVLDDEYDSESDSDYLPDCSLSSESSDSELSSVDEDEAEEGDPNQSVRETESTEKTATPQMSSNGDHPVPTA